MRFLMLKLNHARQTCEVFQVENCRGNGKKNMC